MPWPYDTAPPPLEEEEYRLLRELIRSRIGLDFGPSRRDILASRLSRRLSALSLRSYLEYYRYLLYARRDQREREFSELADVLANHETYFFREAYQFELLYKVAWGSLPWHGPNVRILSAGCSTGEEAYSLLMAAREGSVEPLPELVGIDLCAATVEAAKRSIYRQNSFRSTLPFPRERYFVEREPNLFEVKPTLKAAAHFQQANLLDAVELESLGLFDVIFCRNVLIYFDDAALTRVARNFHRILRPGGYLFLGHSESFLGRGLPFEALRLGHHIAYRRSNG